MRKTKKQLPLPTSYIINEVNFPSRVEVYKETDDDWCGSFTLTGNPRLLVRVSMHSFLPSQWSKPGAARFKDLIRVCVWGNDDCGYEMDFEPEQVLDAFNFFNKLIALPKLNMSHVKDLGMKHA